MTVARPEVYAAYAERATDLENMLEDYTKMVRTTMDQLKTEMLTVDPQQKFADRQVVEKMKALGTMLESAGDLKIKLARASKMLASVLTPEQRVEETFKYILTLPGEQRRRLINRLVDGHEEQAGLHKWHRNPAQLKTAMDKIREVVDRARDPDE